MIQKATLYVEVDQKCCMSLENRYRTESDDATGYSVELRRHRRIRTV
jgi:hypothetical protein